MEFVFLNAGNGFMGFYGFPGMFYRMDPTYSLVVIGAVICMIASANVNRSFSKYSRYGCKRGTTGAQAAEKFFTMPVYMMCRYDIFQVT